MMKTLIIMLHVCFLITVDVIYHNGYMYVSSLTLSFRSLFTQYLDIKQLNIKQLDIKQYKVMCVGTLQLNDGYIVIIILSF